MKPIRCQRIQKNMNQELEQLEWDDYVYTFTMNKDWVLPNARFVREVSSTNMLHFLKNFESLGVKYSRIRVSAMKSDAPKLINLFDDNWLSKDRKLVNLIKQHSWRSNLAWPTYGYGGALGFTVLFSKQQHLPQDIVDRTITHLAPLIMKFNSWSRTLIHDSYSTQPLSERELDCMLLVTEGKTSKEIAEILSITKSTVDFHVCNSIRKLGVSSRSQAASRISQTSSFPK